MTFLDSPCGYNNNNNNDAGVAAGRRQSDVVVRRGGRRAALFPSKGRCDPSSYSMPIRFSTAETANVHWTRV